MSEIADDMIDGTCCSECGCYFRDKDDEYDSLYSHGYPVLCWDCWDEDSDIPRADVETL